MKEKGIRPVSWLHKSQHDKGSNQILALNAKTNSMEQSSRLKKVWRSSNSGVSNKLERIQLTLMCRILIRPVFVFQNELYDSWYRRLADSIWNCQHKSASLSWSGRLHRCRWEEFKSHSRFPCLSSNNTPFNNPVADQRNKILSTSQKFISSFRFQSWSESPFVIPCFRTTKPTSSAETHK